MYKILKACVLLLLILIFPTYSDAKSQPEATSYKRSPLVEEIINKFENEVAPNLGNLSEEDIKERDRTELDITGYEPGTIRRPLPDLTIPKPEMPAMTNKAGAAFSEAFSKPVQSYGGERFINSPQEPDRKNDSLAIEARKLINNILSNIKKIFSNG
ncbi:hypothetical protein COV25_04205 [candidate division WWE3 bacterium CG10_big_fil_rev_8_21_14_0_10_35_32]|nr:MAG: hypothetical protein COV25_04205 [candidate division WWE3 bacterium CG10_big_fil_rev_8_21_14_0_10_35_32]